MFTYSFSRTTYHNTFQIMPPKKMKNVSKIKKVSSKIKALNSPRPTSKSKVKAKSALPKTEAKSKPKSKSASIKSATKKKEMTRYYKLPTGNMKTKEDVVRAFGYTIEKELDKGGFGTIFIATDNRKKVKVAVKWMDLGIADNDPRMLDTRNELTILEHMRHPYIIRLHCHFLVQIDGKNNMYIFMEVSSCIEKDCLKTFHFNAFQMSTASRRWQFVQVHPEEGRP